MNNKIIKNNNQYDREYPKLMRHKLYPKPKIVLFSSLNCGMVLYNDNDYTIRDQYGRHHSIGLYDDNWVDCNDSNTWEKFDDKLLIEN